MSQVESPQVIPTHAPEMHAILFARGEMMANATGTTADPNATPTIFFSSVSIEERRGKGQTEEVEPTH